jgi:hypothetical protein
VCKKRRKIRYPLTGPALFVIAQTKDGWVFTFPDPSASEEIHETLLPIGGNVSRHYTRKGSNSEERIPAGGLSPEQVAFLREFVTKHITPLDPSQTVYVPQPKALELSGSGGGLLAPAVDDRFPDEVFAKLKRLDPSVSDEWRVISAGEMRIREEGGLVRDADGELALVIRTSPELMFKARVEDFGTALPQLLELDGILGLLRASEGWRKRKVAIPP